MNSTQYLAANVRRLFYVGCVASTVAHVHAATATLELVLDPPVPGCIGCTLSGPGTWNVVARASIGDSYGISRYQVAIRAVTTVLHRSPRTTVDPDDNASPAGFTLLRSNSNQDVAGNGFNFHASQDTVTPTLYPVRGFGQEASSFAAELPGHIFGAPTTQASWSAALLLAEGRYNIGTTPYIDFSASTAGVFTEPTGILTEAAAVGPRYLEGNDQPTVTDAAIDNVFAGSLSPASNPVVHTFSATDDEPVSELVWSNLLFDSYTAAFGGSGSGPLHPATFDAGTQQFSWNSIGSPRGIYKWNVTATDMNGTGWSDVGSLTVSVVGPGPGDYNRDGSVDAADYTIWGDDGVGNFIEQYKRSDYNGNGVVDNEDYQVWKDHFGETLSGGGGGAPSAASVPEPASVIPFGIGLCGLLVLRRSAIGLDSQ